jgi:hypothetical protein
LTRLESFFGGGGNFGGPFGGAPGFLVLQRFGGPGTKALPGGPEAYFLGAGGGVAFLVGALATGFWGSVATFLGGVLTTGCGGA